MCSWPVNKAIGLGDLVDGSPTRSCVFVPSLGSRTGGSAPQNPTGALRGPVRVQGNVLNCPWRVASDGVTKGPPTLTPLHKANLEAGPGGMSPGHGTCSRPEHLTWTGRPRTHLVSQEATARSRVGAVCNPHVPAGTTETWVSKPGHGPARQGGLMPVRCLGPKRAAPMADAIPPCVHAVMGLPRRNEA